MKKLHPTSNLSRYAIPIAILLAILVFVLIALAIVKPADCANSDFFTFWLSGRFVVSGRTLYAPALWVSAHHDYGASWIPNQAFVYPLPLALLFAPLGLLSTYIGFLIWVVLTEIMVCASILLLLGRNTTEIIKRFFPLLIIGVALFRPTWISLLTGQLSGLLLLILAGCVYLWEKGKWWQGNLLLPLLALKPNLGVPVILILALYLALKRKAASLWSAGAAGLALVGVGLLQDPRWLVEYWRIGSTKVAQAFGYSSTLWGLSGYLCGQKASCTFASGGAVSLVLLAGVLYLMVRERAVLGPSLAVGLAVSLTLLLTPYSWPYDQLLLIIPIVILLMEHTRAGGRFLTTACIFLGVDLLAVVLLYIGAMTGYEIWSAFLPLALLGWLVAQVVLQKPSPAGEGKRVPKKAD
jgi:hypothetical protein